MGVKSLAIGIIIGFIIGGSTIYYSQLSNILTENTFLGITLPSGIPTQPSATQSKSSLIGKTMTLGVIEWTVLDIRRSEGTGYTDTIYIDLKSVNISKTVTSFSTNRTLVLMDSLQTPFYGVLYEGTNELKPSIPINQIVSFEVPKDKPISSFSLYLPDIRNTKDNRSLFGAI